MRVTRSAVSLGVLVLGTFGLCATLYRSGGGGSARADTSPSKLDPVAMGYEIFNREWMPNDPRAHGGDGLGPVYNDSSCVACHNSGGSGGGGPVGKNIDILSAAPSGMMPGGATSAGPPPNGSNGSQQASPAALDPLLEVHAGFRKARTVVLHKFGIDPNYDSWRARALSPQGMNAPVTGPQGQVVTFLQTNQIPFNPIGDSGVVTGPGRSNAAAVSNVDAERAGQAMQRARASMFAGGAPASQRMAVGSFIVARSQRNPTPLFGLGAIDAIPDEAIVAMEQREARESPETRGRASRLKDGRVGRLGWKGQTANTEDFVLNACAVELGLEVPGHHQAMTPQAPRYQASGLDLTAEECNALVAYVRSLPKPDERRPSSPEESKHIEAGRSTFASIGCAGCHAQKVGDVVGIFSDLLLHDMGPELGDEGSYDGSSSEGEDDEPLTPRITVAQGGGRPGTSSNGSRMNRGATRREWRTPPLWGFRDSGPYLHDGRAQTLEQAVALHGGQGQSSAMKFFQLSPRERLQVESFLKSLVAPATSMQLAHRGE